jgi:adenylate cyclase
MENENEELWYRFLSEGISFINSSRMLFRILPEDPRCMSCHSPFQGFGARLMKMMGRGQSREDPRFCDACLKFSQDHPGGAFIDTAMVFADVRGSTALAERVGDREFRRLIDRFFQVSASELINSGAMIDRLAGDEAIGFFMSGLAGPEYPVRALSCAAEILKITGHGEDGDPWIPVGVGVHLGNAYVGMVGSRQGVLNFTALGDEVNVGARIANAAKTGEIPTRRKPARFLPAERFVNRLVYPPKTLNSGT